MYLRNAAVSGWNFAMISLSCFSGVLGIGGELGGDVAQDCELLVELYGNADEGAIGAEELIDLF
jgi:hypothetical protein